MLIAFIGIWRQQWAFGTPGVTPLEGGVPVLLDGVVIGAVGVSGAHGANDSLVAETAAAAVSA